MHQRSIRPAARHHEKVPRRERCLNLSDRNARRCGRKQPLHRPQRVQRKPKMPGQRIGRAKRQNPKRRLAVRKPLQHTMHGPIASTSDHHRRLARGGPRKLLRGIGRGRSEENLKRHAVPLQQPFDRSHLVLQHPRPASSRIDDQCGDAGCGIHWLSQKKPTRGVGS